MIAQTSTPETEETPQVESYNRLSIKTEDYQSSSKVSAALLNEAELSAAKHTFQKFDIEFEEDQLTEDTLFTIDLGTDKGGTYQEFRSKEEVIEIIQEHFRVSEEKAEEIFQEGSANGKWSEGPNQITFEDITSIESKTEVRTFKDIIQDPDMVGSSSYRAAADLGACVCEAGDDASECDPDQEMSTEEIEAIEGEMSCLIEAALEIAANCRK